MAKKIDAGENTTLQLVAEHDSISVNQLFSSEEKQQLYGRTFRDVIMDHVDFSDADLRGADFVNVSLRGADFSGADLTRTNFFGCDLRDANFELATIEGARFDRSWMVWTRGLLGRKRDYVRSVGGLLWFS
jgi:hypothetical protein